MAWLQGLLDPALMAKKQKEEQEFRARVAANKEWSAAYGTAWASIAEAEKKAAVEDKVQRYRSLNSQLASFAASVVQYVAEIKKPDGERLAGYHERSSISLVPPVFPRARLSGDGDRAHHRCA